jgi:DNA repair exonuclease SbcCD ATPase subunit
VARQWLAGTGLGILLLGAAAALAWQWRKNVQQSARMAGLAAENQQLRAELEAVRRAGAPPQSAPAPPPGGERVQRAAVARPAESVQSAAAGQTVQSLQDSLAQANASLAGLQRQIQDLQAQLEKATLENQRLSAAGEELNNKLAEANGKLQAMDEELRARAAKAAQLEAANQKLRNQLDAEAQKAAQLAQLSAELQEINRRRNTHLNSILRRYKEVTEQYRTLYAVLDSRRPDAPAITSADLSRIQNSVAMAEEDLHQLSSLNAQAERIQKKLAGK